MKGRVVHMKIEIGKNYNVTFKTPTDKYDALLSNVKACFAEVKENSYTEFSFMTTNYTVVTVRGDLIKDIELVEEDEEVELVASREAIFTDNYTGPVSRE